MCRETAAQARIEPAAILIAAFQIDVSWEAERLATRFKHSNATRTGIKPNVENIGLFSKIGITAFRASKPFRQQFGFGSGIPGISSFLREDVRDVIDDLRVSDGLVTTFTVKDRDRNAPRTLT
jgi:hypothetical protein